MQKPGSSCLPQVLPSIAAVGHLLRPLAARTGPFPQQHVPRHGGSDGKGDADESPWGPPAETLLSGCQI